MRRNWNRYFIEIAKQVSQRATCIRRMYGAVIVDDSNTIVSTGYCGAPRGEENCVDLGVCKRQDTGRVKFSFSGVPGRIFFSF